MSMGFSNGKPSQIADRKNMSWKLLRLFPVLVFCLLAGCAVNPITGEEQLMLIKAVRRGD